MMRRGSWLCASMVTLGLLVFGTMSPAQALLLDGQTVNYQYFFPDLASPYANADNGDKLVGAGVEVSNIVDARGTGDFADTSYTADFTDTSSFSPGAFNGFRITDVNGTIAAFTAVTIDPITNMVGFDISRISFTDNQIFVNWVGLNFDPDTIVKLNINGAQQVPEPASLLLLGAGFVGVAVWGRRRLRR